MSCGLSTNSTPRSSAAAADRHRELAARLGEPGQRDLVSIAAAGRSAHLRASRGCRRYSSVMWLMRIGVRCLRGDADHALRRARSPSRRPSVVAAAAPRCRGAPASRRASAPSHGDAEVVGQRRRAGDRAGCRRSLRRHQARTAAQRRQPVQPAAAARRACACPGSRCPPLIDVGAEQPEQPAIPVCDAMPASLAFMRSNSAPRSRCAGSAPAWIHRGADRVDHEQLGDRVGEDVLPRLVEELERQRDVASSTYSTCDR